MKHFKLAEAKKSIKSFFITAFTLFIITSSFIQGSRVPTPSMEKTILAGDYTLINKLAYNLTTPRNIPFTNIELPHIELLKWGGPQRNDIVVFEFPGDRDEIKNQSIDNYVKRCVGVPGDTIEIIDRLVYINGKEFNIPAHIQYLRSQSYPEELVEHNIFPKGKSWNSDNYGPLVIPKKNDVINLTLKNISQWETFINREYGKDVVDIVNDKIIIDGKEANSYKVTDDYFFMMGDNRDNSLDSRYWGLVPRRNVIGQPMLVYFSWNSDLPWYDIPGLISSIRLDRIGKLLQ